ncbi:MAG: hypothetical protein QOF70_7968, partial [Acetobacteraceae bacterium]|nr:hypothetical protein [Acetobacteraceae bacterium]
YRGERLANVGGALGITVEAIPSSGYSTGCAGGTLASLAPRTRRTVRPGRHLLGG